MKKVLSTVLILSLLVGFSVSVALFASEGNSEGYGLITEEEYYESLTDQDVGNDRVFSEVNPEMVPEGFRTLFQPSMIEFAKIIGDCMYILSEADTSYMVDGIFPFYCDREGRPCDSKGEPIKIIKIPDYIDGIPVTKYNGDFYYSIDLNERFPDLECLVLPRTLKGMFSSCSLKPKGQRPLKVYSPISAIWSYVGGEVPFSGLKVFEPRCQRPAEVVNAFLPANLNFCTLL